MTPVEIVALIVVVFISLCYLIDALIYSEVRCYKCDKSIRRGKDKPNVVYHGWDPHNETYCEQCLNKLKK